VRALNEFAKQRTGYHDGLRFGLGDHASTEAPVCQQARGGQQAVLTDGEPVQQGVWRHLADLEDTGDSQQNERIPRRKVGRLEQDVTGVLVDENTLRMHQLKGFVGQMPQCRV
jgi:hypothetical protein